MKNESKISDHKRFKKELKPPFLQIGNFKTSSWIDERLPEMLWAVLIVGNVEREIALNFFRFVADYVHNNSECLDVTLTGISKFPKNKREGFIRRTSIWSEEIKNALRPLMLFPDLPSKTDWERYLDKPIPQEDLQKLAKGIIKTFWHQSEAATDCRWIKFLCQILGGKMKFSKAIEEIEETLRGIFEYPNYGDLPHIRAFVRASEIGLPLDKEESEWAKKFWDYCHQHTACIPEETANKKIYNRQELFLKTTNEERPYYFKETADIRNKIIDHFFAASKTSAVDARHEGAFGIALYGMTLFIETTFYKTAQSITGRMTLRLLVEALITFKYLLAKEKTEPKIWDTYRTYGTGQLKLLYLKLKELGEEISSIEINNLDNIANEDRWIEFTPVNLGHWDSENLRKMSEEVGLKNLYDKYYNYTSEFIHANWGAIRESIYQRCINSLHRYHRIPIFDLPMMSSITDDAIIIINNILECLSIAYPKSSFKIRKNIKATSSPKKHKEKK